MSSNETPFAKVLRDVFTQPEKQEGISFSVLLALYNMPTSFDNVWLKEYFKADATTRTEKLDAALVELSPDYQEIRDAAQLKSKNMSDDPKEKAKQIDDKEKCTKRRNAALACMRQVLVALVVFRQFDVAPGSKVKIDGKRKLSFKLMLPDAKTGEPEEESFSLSFSEIVKMGDNKLTQLGWKSISSNKSKPAPAPVQQVVAGGQVQGVTPNVREENTNKLFEASLASVKDLVSKTNLATMSNDGVMAVIQLAKACLLKAFGNSKGQIVLDDLAEDFNGILIHENGQRVKLEEERQISSNPENREAA